MISSGRSTQYPILWPASWDVAAGLDILARSPFRAVLTGDDSPKTLASAASARSIACLTGHWVAWNEADWKAQSPLMVGGGVWPSLTPPSQSQSAGPTGVPWLDANGWVLLLARSLAPPGVEVWFNTATPKEDGDLSPAHYELMLAEAWAFGALRPMWLAPKDAADAANKRPGAFEAACAAARWMQGRDHWRTYTPVASLAVISDFSGPNEYASSEVLNLAARQGLAFLPVPLARFTPASLRGKRAALFVDIDPPSKAVTDALGAFASSGGLVLALKSTAGKIAPQGRPLDPHARFDVRQLGKGRVAVSKDGFDDPWLLARDAHLLMSRRWDSFRLFNASSILAYHAASGDGKTSVIHLLNYTRRAARSPVAVQINSAVRRARFHILGRADAAEAQVVTRDGGREIDLPPFAVYCALELEHT